IERNDLETRQSLLGPHAQTAKTDSEGANSAHELIFESNKTRRRYGTTVHANLRLHIPHLRSPRIRGEVHAKQKEPAAHHGYARERIEAPWKRTMWKCMRLGSTGWPQIGQGTVVAVSRVGCSSSDSG